MPRSCNSRGGAVFGRPLLLAPALALALASPVRAQDGSERPVQGHWQFGPIEVTPALSLHDSGWDTNVFNEATQAKSDFTYTLTPGAALVLRLAMLKIAADSQVDFVHFRRYTSERSADTDHRVAVELPLGPLTLGASGSHASARRRPNSEIDTRSRHVDRAAAFQAGVRFSGVTSLKVTVERARVAYARDEVFDGVNLAERLNRDEDHVSAALHYAITPLTTFVLNTDIERRRFLVSPDRDADGFGLLPGLEFDALALLNGRAVAGFRSLEGRAPGLPAFKGFVGSVDLVYPSPHNTRYGFSFERDLRYSYRQHEPYYVLTGWGGSIRQRVAEGWEAEARAGLERHVYKPALAAGGPVDRDVILNYSGRVSREIGTASQLLIDLSLRHRHSPVGHRNYRGGRIFAAVTYGF